MAHKFLDDDQPLSELARKYAWEKHKYVNQSYDIHPYSYHLEMVVDVAIRYIHFIPEDDREEVLAACWVHDMIEDTRESYNNIKKNLNEIIAEYSYRCANEKGRTRAERANDKYYKEIREYRYASFVKLCDRIANVEYSIEDKKTKPSMYKKYKQELTHFYESLYDNRWDEMWKYLENLFKS